MTTGRRQPSGRGGARAAWAGHGGRPAHYPPGHRVNASPPRRHACPEPLNVGFVCVTVCRFAEAIVPTFPSGPSDTCNCQSPLYAPRSTPHRCFCQRRTCSFARSGSALGASPSLSQFRPWYGRVCVCEGAHCCSAYPVVHGVKVCLLSRRRRRLGGNAVGEEAAQDDA